MENKLTIRQAAKLTGYSEAHLRRLAKRGDAFEAEMFGYNRAIDKDSLLANERHKQKKGLEQITRLGSALPYSFGLWNAG